MLCALSIIGEIYFDLGLITQCTLIICFCLGFFQMQCLFHVMAGPTTRSSSKTQEVAGPSTVGVVEELEDNISTLKTSISPLGISPFKKQRLQRSKQYAKVKVKWVGTAIKQRLQAMNVEVSDTSSNQTGESEIMQQLKDAFHASIKKKQLGKTKDLGRIWCH